MTGAAIATLEDEMEAARLVPWREELRFVERLLRDVGRPTCAYALTVEALAKHSEDHGRNWFIRRLLALVALERVETWAEWNRGKVVLRFQAVQ